MYGWRPRAATRRCSTSAPSGALSRVRAGLLHASTRAQPGLACARHACSWRAPQLLLLCAMPFLLPNPAAPCCPMLPVHAGSSPCSCSVTLEQEVHPKGLPPFFHNAFRAMAALQVGAPRCLHCCAAASPAALPHAAFPPATLWPIDAALPPLTTLACLTHLFSSITGAEDI